MPLSEEQKSLRRLGIGSSDVGSAVGLCPYRSPLQLYREKLGEVEVEETWPMFLGNVLEDAIVKMFVRATKATNVLRPTTLFHASEPWMLATVDALATVPDGRRVIVECKRADYKRPEWGRAGTSDIPVTYACQALWQLEVMRSLGEPVDEVHVAAFFRGNDFQIFPVPFDAGRVAWLKETARDFWFSHVVERHPPGERHAA